MGEEKIRVAALAAEAGTDVRENVEGREGEESGGAYTVHGRAAGSGKEGGAFGEAFSRGNRKISRGTDEAMASVLEMQQFKEKQAAPDGRQEQGDLPAREIPTPRDTPLGQEAPLLQVGTPDKGASSDQNVPSTAEKPMAQDVSSIGGEPMARDAASIGGERMAQDVPPTGRESMVQDVPMGRLFAARSGDKGGNANLGVWAKNPEAFAFLREFLTEKRLRTLLPDLAPFEVERYELSNLLALNFYIRGILGHGVADNDRIDGQAKTLGEYLRVRKISVPESLLRRGR